jgi:hypothetical protein
MRSLTFILVFALQFCGVLSVAQNAPVKKPKATNKSSKVLSRQFRKSAMLAQLAWSKFAESLDDKDLAATYEKRTYANKDEADRATALSDASKERADVYRDEADRATVVARADVENSADSLGALCLLRYVNLVLRYANARGEIRVWIAKNYFSGQALPASLFKDQNALYDEQHGAGDSLEGMLNEGRIGDCAWGPKSDDSAKVKANAQ